MSGVGKGGEEKRSGKEGGGTEFEKAYVLGEL